MYYKSIEEDLKIREQEITHCVWLKKLLNLSTLNDPLVSSTFSFFTFDILMVPDLYWHTSISSPWQLNIRLLENRSLGCNACLVISAQAPKPDKTPRTRRHAGSATATFLVLLAGLTPYGAPDHDQSAVASPRIHVEGHSLKVRRCALEALVPFKI